MKKILLVLSAVLVFLMHPQRAQAEITIDFFYDSLQPYGDWLYLDDYGYCWQPAGVDADWRPYTDGYWTYTDDGWTWVSYEDFGWATYHYGRWVRLENLGWVWVPGYEWGAAWVSWRYSDEYVGWAPLPPQAICTPEYAIDSYVDVDYDLGPEYYTFTTCQNFGSPYIRKVVIRPEINITIINRTVNVTNITFQHNVIVFGGPRFDRIARFTERPIERLKIERRVDIDVRGKDRNFFARKNGGTLTVVAPDVAPDDRDIKPRKIKETVAKTTPDRGWSGIRDKTLADETRRKIRAQNTQPRISPAPDRQASRPAAETLRKEARRSAVRKADSPDAARQPNPTVSNRPNSDQPQATPVVQDNPRNQNPRRNQDRQPDTTPVATPAPRENRQNKRPNRDTSQSQTVTPTPNPETDQQPDEAATRRQQAQEAASQRQQAAENARRQQAQKAASQQQQAAENARRQQAQEAAVQRQQAAENARRQQAREQAANAAQEQQATGSAQRQQAARQAAIEQQRAQQAARQQQLAEQQARVQQQRRQQAAQQQQQQPQQQPAQTQKQTRKAAKKVDPNATPTPN